MQVLASNLAKACNIHATADLEEGQAPLAGDVCLHDDLGVLNGHSLGRREPESGRRRELHVGHTEPLGQPRELILRSGVAKPGSMSLNASLGMRGLNWTSVNSKKPMRSPRAPNISRLRIAPCLGSIHALCRRAPMGADLHEPGWQTRHRPPLLTSTLSRTLGPPRRARTRRCRPASFCGGSTARPGLWVQDQSLRAVLNHDLAGEGRAWLHVDYVI